MCDRVQNMYLGCQCSLRNSKLLIIALEHGTLFLTVSELYNLEATINDLLLMKYSAVETFLKCTVDKSC